MANSNIFANDPIMRGRLRWWFSHNELQNSFIISELLEKHKMMDSFGGGVGA